MTHWLDDRDALAESQARSIEIGRVWAGAIKAHVRAAFADAEPADLEQSAAAAERLLADDTWVGETLPLLMRALRNDPAFTPPLRIHRSALRTLAVLHDGEHGIVSVNVISSDVMASLPRPVSLVAGGRMSVLRYCKARGATLKAWDAPMPAGDLAADAVPRCTPAGSIPLVDGMVLRLDGRTRAHVVEGAVADVVTLTVSLRAGAAAQAREYSCDDGRLLLAAEVGDTESRMRMLMTLLRISGRTDAGPCFDAATREPGFALRWAAMREWLALDARAAMPRLAEMTGDANAEVRAAARATLAMVEERLAA